MPLWALDTVSIAGGFLSDVSLRFPAGLICVIGPRGSGKSTLAEAIRLALAGVPNGASKPRMDLLKANLGSAVIGVTTRPGTDRGGFTVRRTFGQTAIVTGPDSRPITTIDLDRGTFLPLDSYSSLDIEAIADEALGSKRRNLLDELCPTEMQDVHLRLADQHRAIESNSAAIKAVEAKIREITERIEELGDVKARLEALPPSEASAGSPEFQAASAQKLLNEREARSVATVSEMLKGLHGEFSSTVARARTQVPSPLVESESANAALLQSVDRILANLWSHLDRIGREASEATGAATSDIAGAADLLRGAHQSQEASYLALQHQNQEATKLFMARASAERDAATLTSLLQQRTAAMQERARLEQARKGLKTDYILTRDTISELREGVAARLQAQAGTKVRVHVVRNADSLGYQERLLTALYGTKLKNQEDILKSLAAIRPEDLALIVQQDDLRELEAHAQFGKERGRKILDALKANLDPLAIEVMPIDDRVVIELNVSTSAASNFKHASELSRGQKCTALLPILLARRDTPLVIDQPEDNLDNHFIYETVVDSIRRLKQRRQMIFITHNANIPVLGEAELVVVMNSDGKRGFVQKAGTVDECRDEIIDLLEGGEEAFQMRSRRYGA